MALESALSNDCDFAELDQGRNVKPLPFTRQIKAVSKYLFDWLIVILMDFFRPGIRAGRNGNARGFTILESAKTYRCTFHLFLHRFSQMKTNAAGTAGI